MRDGERWGKPSREHVEELLLQVALDKARASELMKGEYRAEQINSFRKKQDERKRRQGTQPGLYVLRSPPEYLLEADDLASEAASRRASLTRQEEIEAQSAKQVAAALELQEDLQPGSPPIIGR